MPTLKDDVKPKRRGTPRNPVAAGRARWAPQARTDESVRVIVDNSGLLTAEQRETLRAALAALPPLTPDEIAAAGRLASRIDARAPLASADGAGGS